MKILKKISKYLLFLFIFLLVLLAGAYFFIQTELFNKWALDYTFNKLNSGWEQKNNRVSAESLNGNILKGIKINNGCVTVKGDTLISFSSLEVKYDLWSLLKYKISIEYIDINSPKINLIGQKINNDSTIWNYQNLFSPSTEIDTSTSKFDWDVSVSTFKIENGSIRIIGNRQGNIPVWQIGEIKEKEFDFYNLAISSLQLDMGADYYKDKKNLYLNNLSFNTNSDFNIKKLAINAGINEKDIVTNINYLELVTDRSNIKIDKINIAGFDPLDSVNTLDFMNKNMAVKLDFPLFNFADLKFFVPSADMLDSMVALNLDAKGKLSDLTVNSLTVKLPNSYVNFKGNVKNINNPDSIYFDITANNLQIYPHDVLTVVKIPSIPDYSNLGNVLANIYFKGTPQNFYSEYDIKTDAGYINGVTNLDLDNEAYNGNVTTHQINLGKILKDNKLNSSINLSAKFSGSGFALNKMTGNVNYSMTSSSMAGYNIAASTGEIKAAHSNFDINVKAATSAGNTSVTGKINIANTKNPVYVLKGKVSGLDVSKFTKKADDKSNLNLAFDINGRGSNLNNINGKYVFTIENSIYSKYRIPQTPLNIDIVNSGSISTIKVITDMADFNANGNFDIGSISNAVQYNISALTNILQRKLNPDSSFVYKTSGIKNINTGNVNLNYSLVIKDTVKLTQILQPFGIIFNGDVKGNIINSSAGLNSSGTVKIKNFQYQDTVIVLKNVNTDFAIKTDYSSPDGNSFSAYNIVLNTTGDRIIFGSNKIDSSRINLNLTNSIAQLSASAKQDSSMKVKIAGNFDLSGNNIIANIDSIKAKYNLYEVSNNNKWIIYYSPGEEIKFEQLGIRSKNLVFNVNGNYSFTGSSDITIKSDSIPFHDIFTVLRPVDTTIVKNRRQRHINGGVITKLNINFKGSIANPEVNAELSTNTLKYDAYKVGTINANVIYKDEILTPDIVILNDSTKGSLTLAGNAPFKNPFVHQDSSGVTTLNGPIGLTLTTKNFQIRYFVKLIPNNQDVGGLLNGEITASGNTSNPNLKGNLALTDGSLFLPLTGMNYDFNFKMSTENSKLLLDKFSILNPSDDSKHFDLTGNMDFKDMKINDIDLQAMGDFYVLDNTVDNNELGITGVIDVGSGSPPITIKGNLEKLNVAGQLLIKDATIETIPMKSNGYDLGSDNFVYINNSDSALLKHDSLIVITQDEYNKINPFEKFRFMANVNKSSILDFLNMDVNVKTDKNLNIDLSLNGLTRTRLYGEVQADMNLKTVNHELNATGNINVVGNSYFRFFRDFKLSDSKITFNGPITNPNLDLKAVYTAVKNNSQYGTITSVPIQIFATVTGSADTPKVSLKLLEDGDEITESDAQGDAVVFLLFGKYKSELSDNERQVVASSVGSYYVSSYITDALKQVLPFIVGAEFNANSVDIGQNTDVAVTSAFGDATVKVGSHEVNSVNYFEFTIDYPINKLINVNLPETLLLEIAKEEIEETNINSSDQHSRTGIKIIYKFRF